MKFNRAPSALDLIFLVVAPYTAIRGTVKLTQSDGDLAAHIRMGKEILSTGHIPTHSLASFTAPADYMVAHAWLSEIFFALLFKIGGLPLLSVITGIIVGLTHGSIAIFLRRRGVDPRWAFLAALLSLPLGSTHWLTRPHMFSIAFSAITLFLLESDRRRRALYFFPLFVLWANLHGGWAYGLVMIGTYIVGDILEAYADPENRADWIRAAKENAAAFTLGFLATFVNPYGIRLHEEVFFAVTSSSLAKNIAEYQAPNFQDIGQWPFLLAILATVTLFAFGTKRIRFTWLLLIVMSLFFSLRSFRNIALFGVAAWPLIALHTARSWPSPRKPFRFFTEFARLDPHSMIGMFAVPVTILMLALGLNHGAVAGAQLIPDSFSPKKFPTQAVARARAARLDGRVFDSWGWGGYIMYAWPEARLHVDPLKFNDETIKSYSIIEDLQPGWQKEIDRWGIRTIIVHSKSPTAKGLALEPGWKVWYKDSTATIFRPAGIPST